MQGIGFLGRAGITQGKGHEQEREHFLRSQETNVAVQRSEQTGKEQGFPP